MYRLGCFLWLLKNASPYSQENYQGGGKSEMWAFFYSFTICVVAVVLFLIVDKFEPDRRYANVLKLIILALGAAAIARQLLP
jgi:surface polysaccharide O-acyltransferase-like enzyme